MENWNTDKYIHLLLGAPFLLLLSIKTWNMINNNNPVLNVATFVNVTYLIVALGNG